MLENGELPDLDGLKADMAPPPSQYPQVCVELPLLASYDALLEEVA